MLQWSRGLITRDSGCACRPNYEIADCCSIKVADAIAAGLPSVLVLGSHAPQTAGANVWPSCATKVFEFQHCASIPKEVGKQTAGMVNKFVASMIKRGICPIVTLECGTACEAKDNFIPYLSTQVIEISNADFQQAHLQTISTPIDDMELEYQRLRSNKYLNGVDENKERTIASFEVETGQSVNWRPQSSVLESCRENIEMSFAMASLEETMNSFDGRYVEIKNERRTRALYFVELSRANWDTPLLELLDKIQIPIKYRRYVLDNLGEMMERTPSFRDHPPTHQSELLVRDVLSLMGSRSVDSQCATQGLTPSELMSNVRSKKGEAKELFMEEGAASRDMTWRKRMDRERKKWMSRVDDLGTL